MPQFAVKHFFSNLKIRTKLIILFILIKVIPLILLAVITLFGIHSLYDFFIDNTKQVKQVTKQVVSTTANTAVEDSILALDRKTQESLERISGQIAKSVADFLYERDADLRILASLPRNQRLYEDFMQGKVREVIKDQSDNYRYDDKKSAWVKKKSLGQEKRFKKADLADNAREFNRIDTVEYAKQPLPIYKEITFFDLNGQEKIKVSSLNNKKEDISNRENTYIKAETYFKQVQNLKKGQIYVSDVIGAYVPGKIIGSFTKEKAQQADIAFTPEQYGYAGKENPVGKRFEGIIRFVTPVFDGDTKVGYVSLALDHRHIMEFTDRVNPLGYSSLDVSDASEGNYAFMWDYKGRSISHARDYFITGFDPKTGRRATPWLSSEVEQEFIKSKQSDINAFLQTYPNFDAQSIAKKPSPTGLKNGLVGLDCRYLNFAPQCHGWMQLTQHGGLGSFIILWSNVWKLTTAATIPYYTGHYGDTPRGFGFVTMGASVDEFHKAANKTKENLNGILVQQLGRIDNIVGKTQQRTKKETDMLVNQLTYSTFAMVVLMIGIAIWLSNHLRRRLQKLIVGANEYSQNNLSYRISVESQDEIGVLSTSFNNMANSLQDYVQKEKELNQSLEARIEERTEQLTVLNRRIQQELTEKEKQEQQLKIYARIFGNTTEAIVITDVQGKIEHVNEAFTVMTGYLPEDVIGESYNVLRSDQHSLSFYRSIWQTIFSKESWEGEVWTRKKDGSLYPALVIIVPIMDKNGQITNFAGIQHDMSEMKENEQALHRQAYYDPLTELANRSLAYDRLEHAIVNAKSNNSKVAVLFLDLDKFKQVNDIMGHDAGDMLLCDVGKRLSAICKETDTISRLGGDEFLIILEGISFYEDAIHVVENIIKSLAEPFVVNEQVIHSSTSVGITFYPDDGVTVRRLLKNSDIAMYRAKAKGRGVYEVFTEELGLQVQESVLLEHALKEAVIHQDFIMHYQPIVDLKDRMVVGVEALIRWKREGKLYYPDAFIDVLEHTKLIVDATENMMADLFSFTKMLNSRYHRDIYLSVNISAMHFALDDFCERMMKLVNSSMIKPELICLEVTETIFLEDINVVSTKLKELKQLGVKIALDDFGTGYSSLSYLKILPLDKIKIDRAFIQGLPDSAGDVAITTSVCSWGENFNLDVVAEGVETEEQLAFLEQSGCKLIQGYLFAKPMDETALLEYLDGKYASSE